MEAANTGTATRKPACAGESASCLEMNGASGPNITHVVKPVSKYRKQASSAFQLPLLRESINCFITGSKTKTPPTLRVRCMRRVGGVALRKELDAIVMPRV